MMLLPFLHPGACARISGGCYSCFSPSHPAETMRPFVLLHPSSSLFNRVRSTLSRGSMLSTLPLLALLALQVSAKAMCRVQSPLAAIEAIAKPEAARSTLASIRPAFSVPFISSRHCNNGNLVSRVGHT